METKKACILHTPKNKADADVVAQKLGNNGYDTCVTEVTAEEAKSVRTGDASSISSAVKDCLDGAEVCVIILDEAVDFGGIGGIASDGGCSVVTVGGDPDDLPSDLDDVIDGHVPSPDDSELVVIVEGEPNRVKPDHTTAPPRKPDTVKCQ